MKLGELKQKMIALRARGYIPTGRVSDTGIGKTIEDALGIKENNLPIPDLGIYELKAKRIESDSMLTLTTKSPQPRGVNKALFDTYKYLDGAGYYNLHSTVSAVRENQQGFKLTIKGDNIVFRNPQDVEAYYSIDMVEEVLKKKSENIFLVLAEVRGDRKNKTEEFRFSEAYLLSGLQRNRIIECVKSGALKVDFRIGVYRTGKMAGKYHDHGTGLRIMKRDFLKLYDNLIKII